MTWKWQNSPLVVDFSCSSDQTMQLRLPYSPLQQARRQQ
jgi:hypothetical protein